MTEATMTGFETLALHGGQEPDGATNARAVPIYQTTSYVFNDTDHAARLFGLKEFGNIYTRIMNPTTDVLEKRIAALEGGVVRWLFASGQAAETHGYPESGRRRATRSFPPRACTAEPTTCSTIRCPSWASPSGSSRRMPEAVAAAITDKTKAVSLGDDRQPDFEHARHQVPWPSVAMSAGVPLMLDNTLPTPYLVRPFDHGANIVVHSATKFIGGHGTSIGGLVVDGGTFDWAASGRFPEFTTPDPSYHGLVYSEVFTAENFGANIAYIIKLRVQLLRDMGASMSPFNAFMFLQGLETLPLRMERHSQNAAAVARYLTEHPKVTWVNYPGMPTHPAYQTASKYHRGGCFGAILGFGIKGGSEAGRRFIDNLALFSHLANVGDAKSLAIHPATTTHSQLSEAERRRPASPMTTSACSSIE